MARRVFRGLGPWRAIVESLKNPVQQRIVSDDRE